jgi:hypothetical protein
MLRIWGRTDSINVQKVMGAVGEFGLEHERIDAGGAFGDLDTPAYGRLNPNRRVPTVEDGDLVVWEQARRQHGRCRSAIGFALAYSGRYRAARRSFPQSRPGSYAAHPRSGALET